MLDHELLSKKELYTSFFKTEKSLIKFDEIKEYLEKSIAKDLLKEKRLNGIPINWEKNIHWLYEYIRDQFSKHHFPKRSTLTPLAYEVLMTQPGELHPTINDIDIYDLHNSPDYTVLFGITGKATLNFFYNDNRHKDKQWFIDLNKDQFIIFSSSIKYDISPNKGEDNRYIIKIKTNCIE